MKIIKSLFCLSAVMLSVMAIMAGACSGKSASTNFTTTTTGAITAGYLAASGQTLFATYCAKCHGANGQGVIGPAVIGSGAALSKYHTAQGLLDFIDTTMPFDAPGSLAHVQYLDLLAFLLVHNNDMTSGAAFSESGLASVTLK